MPFGNDPRDYPGETTIGFGASSGIDQETYIPQKTAEADTQSALCPKCQHETVKDQHVGLDCTGIKPICTNPNCD